MPVSFPLTFFSRPVQYKTVLHRTEFKTEKAAYPVIAKIGKNSGCLVIRAETTSKQGFPDFLFLRKNEYIFVEVKRATKIINDYSDLHWQFGQIPFALELMRAGGNYMLAVVYKNLLSFVWEADRGYFFES